MARRITQIILAALALSGCYHMKNARFVDESDRDPSATVWLCVEDSEEALNAGGLMCADLRAVEEVRRQRSPSEM